ncbi:hypothetical protein B0H13DRAFT_2579225 [Mycena leptocephala]|nr:hypothetical protein B0H13DRAFT_2579225 [Mycena leptocephala]
MARYVVVGEAPRPCRSEDGLNTKAATFSAREEPPRQEDDMEYGAHNSGGHDRQLGRLEWDCLIAPTKIRKRRKLPVSSDDTVFEVGWKREEGISIYIDRPPKKTDGGNLMIDATRHLSRFRTQFCSGHSSSTSEQSLKILAFTFCLSCGVFHAKFLPMTRSLEDLEVCVVVHLHTRQHRFRFRVYAHPGIANSSGHLLLLSRRSHLVFLAADQLNAQA